MADKLGVSLSRVHLMGKGIWKLTVMICLSGRTESSVEGFLFDSLGGVGR